jgi:hypothetical protein
MLRPFGTLASLCAIMLRPLGTLTSFCAQLPEVVRHVLYLCTTNGKLCHPFCIRDDGYNHCPWYNA